MPAISPLKLPATEYPNAPIYGLKNGGDGPSVSPGRPALIRPRPTSFTGYWSGRCRGFQGVRPPGGGSKGEAAPLSPRQAKWQTARQEIPTTSGWQGRRSLLRPQEPSVSPRLAKVHTAPRGRGLVVRLARAPPTATANRFRDGPSISPGRPSLTRPRRRLNADIFAGRWQGFQGANGAP